MLRALAALALALLPAPALASADWIDTAPGAEGFPIAGSRGAATVVVAAGDYEVVRIAAADLQHDIADVSGRSGGGEHIWAGTLGRNPDIDRLVREHRIDVGKLQGAWESFVIATVDHPVPGIPRALVIVGSDRRGTAYGLYELSRAIGVSPWHWWADVTPERHADLHVRPGTRRFGPPSVKYRGIFINDEDWGLAPWAAGNFEPEHGGVGPKTYARVFELMLRLKANTLWPAMHRITPPFNADPANAALADRYGIVMGSSHAEPMLRNNVGEWQAPPEAFDYTTNRDGVLNYWDERVAANGRFETIYTLGMRGIHDSAMAGPADLPGRRALLERIFADQRALIAKHVDPAIERVPQMFAPYKEVLDIYRAGLRVPDDVTILWPDDNFGYIRRFPNAAERRRSGGSGVYYHLSYLGAPLAYLWLSTTPPALIGEEMGRAYDLGADRIWIANVGDIKPAELATDYFLSLAWDVPGTRAKGVDGFIRDWAAETIDPAQADAIAAILAEHHRLNFERRPEHLQWWLPGQKPRPSPYSIPEADTRLAAFAANRAALAKVASRIPPARRDAFFELLGYPVEAAALANRRFFAAEAYDRLRDDHPAEAGRRGADARDADEQLRALTSAYNLETARGKWRGIMAEEPADGQWKGFRTTAPVLPPPYPGALSDSARAHAVPPEPAPPLIVEAESVTGQGWRRIEGLGSGGAMIASAGASRISYAVTLPPGRWRLVIDLLPTYPDADTGALHLTLERDDVAIPLTIARETGNPAWAEAALANRIAVPVEGVLEGGAHRIGLLADDGGVIVDRVRFERVPGPDLAVVPYNVIPR